MATALCGGAAFMLLPWDARSSAAPDRAGESDLFLPAPVRPAFTVPTPQPLLGRAAGSTWAPVLRPIVARAGPSAAARPVARVDRLTPEGTTNIVLVVARAKDDSGALWVRVRLAILPNNLTGWVPRSILGGSVAVETHLVVDLDRLTATLLRQGRPVFRADIGVGTSAAPTPRGRFYVRNKVTAYSSRFYGPVAFGTSARSAVLTDWPAGGFVGIHGTDRPDLLPGRVSHGCIRMRNADILRLSQLMPVGTPIMIT